MAGWILISLAPLFIDVLYTDIRYRIIRNTTTFFIAFILLTGGVFSSSGFYWTSALSILAGGFFLSLVNIMGAGDIKLMAALSLSLNAEETLAFLFSTALAGLPLIMLVLLVNCVSSRFAEKKTSKTLPYGVAVVSGYLATLYLFRAPV